MVPVTPRRWAPAAAPCDTPPPCPGRQLYPGNYTLWQPAAPLYRGGQQLYPLWPYRAAVTRVAVVAVLVQLLGVIGAPSALFADVTFGRLPPPQQTLQQLPVTSGQRSAVRSGHRSDVTRSGVRSECRPSTPLVNASDIVTDASDILCQASSRRMTRDLPFGLRRKKLRTELSPGPAQCYITGHWACTSDGTKSPIRALSDA